MKIRKPSRSIMESMNELKKILEDQGYDKNQACEEAGCIVRMALEYGDYRLTGVCGLRNIAVPYERFYQGNKYKKQTLAAISQKRG